MRSACRRSAFAAVLTSAALLVAPICASRASAGELIEPTEKELRTAYLAFLHDFVASQGEPTDPACRLDGPGCTVRLVDVRRSYRLTSFRKIGCQPAEAAGFVCSFAVKVDCTWSSDVPPDPALTDLYCEPIFNKVSTLVARVSYIDGEWNITRFLQG